MVNVDAALRQEFLDFTVREAVAEVPTNGANDDLGFKLPPLEQPRSPVHVPVQATNPSW
jgi:hypothetical protein